MPAGAHLDSNIEFWDAWYGSKVLAGQADRYLYKFLVLSRGCFANVPSNLLASGRFWQGRLVEFPAFGEQL